MRRAAVLATILGVLPMGPVLAQTTTTSSTSTTLTSTTLTSTTTTTAPPVVVDADPPAALLTGASGEVRGGLGSFCWAPPGAMAGRCVDKTGPDARPSLTVTAGETLTLRFATGLAVTQVSGRAGTVDIPLPDANPSRFTVALAPGTYNFDVLTRFSAGDASYAFVLRVTAPPATPMPAPKLTLTG